MKHRTPSTDSGLVPIALIAPRAATPLVALLAVGSLCLAGCGSGYDIAPVSGTVTMDGNPLADVVVTFQPVSTANAADVGMGSHGITDAQGKYTLQLSGKEQPGAVVGPHRISFAINTPTRDIDDDTAAPPPSVVIPAKYQTEPLQFEVPAGGTTSADFALTSQGSGSSGTGSSWPGGGS